MSLKIAGLSKTALETSELLYNKLTSDVSYQQLNPSSVSLVGEAAASNIHIVKDSKNRVIHEVAAVIETLYLEITKSYQDAAIVGDISRVSVSKAAQDITSTLDNHSVNVNKAFGDTSGLQDYLALFLVKGYSDFFNLVDNVALGVTKTAYDELSAVDEFNSVVTFVRYFKDFVAIDDFAQFDKYYNGVKHNVALAQDVSLWEFVKSNHDTIDVHDLPIWAFHKTTNDVITLPDTLALGVNVQLPEDLVNAVDTVSFSSIKYAPLSACATTDASVLQNTLNKLDLVQINDLVKFTTARVLADVISSSDYINLQASVAKHDSFNTHDTSVIDSTKATSDLVNIVDLNKSSVHKPVANTSFVLDSPHVQTTKTTSDSYTIADSTSWDLINNPKDASTLTDANRIAMSKVASDTANIVDTPAIRTHLDKSDTLGVIDIIDMVLVDFKLVISPEVLTTFDAYNITTSKQASEYVTNIDSDRFSFVKKLSDYVSIGDLLNISPTIATGDSVAMDDSITASRERVATKHNVSFIADHMTRGFTKNLIDFVAVNSYSRLQFLTKLDEALSVSDFVNIEIFRGGSAMFNASTFNQSTFG